MPAQSLNDDASPALPRMVAEVLVRRLSAPEVAERAKADGLSGDVADMAIKICGCRRDAAMPSNLRASSGPAAR